MQPKLRNTRNACIAIVLVGLAIGALPAVSATCVGSPPPWWNDQPGNMCYSVATFGNPWWVCVTDYPVQSCV